MSNIKMVDITADVPFDYLDKGAGLSDEERAFLASALLGPSLGLEYEYRYLGTVPNEHGGATAMYRIRIQGEEALSWPYLKKLAMTLKRPGPYAKLHVAEAKDIEDNGVWTEIVDEAELSGEALPGGAG